MTRRAGERLGPYEIVGPVGAGGMGEVYKARDTRIGRLVAIKVLPLEVESDRDRRRRFHQEAVAAGALNHPNLLVVHDVGMDGERPYLVTELLAGRTLRDALRDGPLSEARAVAYSAALLDGLAAAHSQGIVHRDVKPENIFITSDDVPKLLDFGLARLPDGFHSGDQGATASGTQAGALLGSVGYMAPEQVTGGTVDARTDLFSIAVVLYEMVVGRTPFARATPIESLNAIVTADVEAPASVSPPLRAILQRGLQKSPARRFQSASDFAFALALPHASVPAATTPRPGSRALIWAAGLVTAAALALAAVLGAKVRGGVAPAPVEPRYERITFEPGRVWSARFVHGSDAIAYAAGWNDQPNRLYTARIGFPAATELQLPPADLLAVSSTGQLAFLLGRRWLQGMEPSSGVLAQAAMAGTAPRELANGVTAADWSPDGKELAIVRELVGARRLEFPIGHAIYETAGWIDNVRVSPDGTRVAFAHHPVRSDDRGDFCVADRGGTITEIGKGLGAADGLAWGPDGRELWASIGGRVVAFDLKGASRTVFRDPRNVSLEDVSPDGKVLIRVEQKRMGMSGRLAGAPAERDLTWFDYSVARDISRDGKSLLFFEAGDASGDEYTVGLWRAGETAPLRLGDGHAVSLSADGQLALATKLTGATGLRILPTGAGSAREVLTPRLAALQWATWLPGNERILVSGNEPGGRPRLFVIDLAGNIVSRVGPEGTAYYGNGVSPDGTRVAAQDPEQRLTLYGIGANDATIVTGVSADERAVGWTADAAELFVLTPGVPCVVSRVNIATGARTRWRELMPPDRTGVVRISPVLVTPDGGSYVYTYGRFLSTLYVVTGVR